PTSSRQPIGTAAIWGRSPTIISAEFISAAASCPCVTTTTPNFMRMPGRPALTRGPRNRLPALRLEPDVPVHDAKADAAQAGQSLLQRFGHRHGAMPPAGAADADGQVRLALAHVLRDQEREQVERVAQEG